MSSSTANIKEEECDDTDNEDLTKAGLRDRSNPSLPDRNSTVVGKIVLSFTSGTSDDIGHLGDRWSALQASDSGQAEATNPSDDDKERECECDYNNLVSKVADVLQTERDNQLVQENAEVRAQSSKLRRAHYLLEIVAKKDGVVLITSNRACANHGEFPSKHTKRKSSERTPPVSRPRLAGWKNAYSHKKD